MPLFKSKKGEATGYPKQPSYPTQAAGQVAASAPMMSGGPYQSPSYPGMPPQQQPCYGYGGQPPQGPPPPYYSQEPPSYPGPPVQGYNPHRGPPPAYPQHYSQPSPQYQYVQQQQQPQTVVVQGGFDAGARFDTTGTATIPPPPPGCMPNAAQMAQMSGANVIVTQRPQNFMTGGSDGGYTMW